MFQNQNPANNGVGALDPTQQQPPPTYNGMQQQHQQQQQQQQQQPLTNKNIRKKPYVKITEQPAGKALRFRYECEGRSAGSIPGVNSTPENKTFPSIEIVGYKGRAVVVVSCVTKDTPYRPHPHNLVGKEGCKKGVCTLEINSETMRAVFSNLGIQCVKKKDIEGALKAREEIRVDPYKTGFSHRFQPSSIDLNSVRLCFQVFMESEQKGRFTQPLPPVVSEPIFDKKAMSDLVICRLCSCSSTVLGNTQIILLCEKVAKEDITVRFFEEKNGLTVWEAFGEFQHTDVHKQTAIAFKTPKYHTIDITEPAKVFIQLRRPSDGVTSEALPFEYVPLDSDPAHLRRKRQKTGGDPMHLLLQQQQKQQQQQHQQNNDHQDGRQAANRICWNTPNIPAIKTEPRETSPQPFALYRAPPEMTPSPQPLSPANNYQNHNNHNTPSPFSIATVNTVGSTPNPLQISPNQHHYNAGANTPGAGSLSQTPSATPMDMQDYAAYAQQQHHHQQQQQQQQQHQHAAHAPHQQHFQGNPFVGAGAGHWEEKYTTAVNVPNNMNNPSNSNHFAMHNLLSTAGSGSGGNAVGASGLTQAQHWNLMHHPQHQLHPHMQQQQQHLQHPHQQHNPQQQQQQQQYHQQPATAEADSHVPNNLPNNVDAGTGNTNENAPTLSNLLNFDSEQLVRINSEDQQMLRLNSEDLQISNLSIST